MQLVLTPELLLAAYRQGLFPMAHSANSPYVQWICPEMRGQLPIADLHIPRRLLHTLRRAPFEIRIDTAFNAVIKMCAQPTPKRPETWINNEIIKVFSQLHKHGHAHSVECWCGDQLVGGVYGLKLGSAFFGESMFSTMRDASKVALVHLTARLWAGGFTLFDTQFVNSHLEQFGVYETPHVAYMKALHRAAAQEADFNLASRNQEEILRDYLQNREREIKKEPTE